MVAQAVLNEAVEMTVEQRKSDFKSLQAIIQNGVAKALGA